MPFDGLAGEQKDAEQSSRLERRLWLQSIPLTLLGNAVIAVLLTALTREPLAESLVYANAIGLSILALHALGHWLLRRKRFQHWIVTAVSIPLGSGIGLVIAWWIQGASIREHLHTLGGTAVSSLMIGGAATWFFWARARLAVHREQERTHELEQAESARRLAEAELKLLQAQIEPHFLFNTLANIHSLIKEDPDTASLILEQLNKYLRTSLSRTREATGTVGEELELVETLLGIAAARLGRRLDYTISSPAEVRGRPLPPLLLQPLVENAIRHGIEPAVDGGTIRIEVADRNDALELTVTDTGVGLDENKPQGVGLANVRARLDRIFAGKGRLALYTNVPHGVVAKLTIPGNGAVQ
jgi:hypothetical protein